MRIAPSRSTLLITALSGAVTVAVTVAMTVAFVPGSAASPANSSGGSARVIAAKARVTVVGNGIPASCTSKRWSTRLRVEAPCASTAVPIPSRSR